MCVKSGINQEGNENKIGGAYQKDYCQKKISAFPLTFLIKKYIGKNLDFFFFFSEVIQDKVMTLSVLVQKWQ